MLRNGQLPVWNEREVATTYHIDIHEEERDYSVLPPTDGGQNNDYLQWINAYKEPLHDTIRSVYAKTLVRLERRGIDLARIAQTVANITGRPTYPITRIFTSHDLRSDPEYIHAVRGGLFNRAMSFGEKGVAYGQFEYTLHFVRLRQAYINRAARCDVVGTIAHELGRATLTPVTYAHFDRLATGKKVHHWFGYSWRHAGKYCGPIIDGASAAKIASVTKRELGIGSPDKTSIAEPYRERRGFSCTSVGAIALDLLNRAAGHTDELAIYRPIWAFMTNIQDPTAREELGSIVHRATKGGLSLEHLEAEPSSSQGLSLDVLQRIEEVCQIDTSQRPSKLLSQTGPSNIY